MTNTGPSDAELQAVVEYVNSTSLVEAARAADQVELELPPVPDERGPMVVRGVRFSPELFRRVNAAAERRGVSFSALIRQWAELALAQEEDDRTISIKDALRALAAVPPSADKAA